MRNEDRPEQRLPPNTATGQPSGRYEIFLKILGHAVRASLRSPLWSWRRIDEAGRVSVHGTHHGSLRASFTAARRHAARFGPAPARVTLRPVCLPDSPAVLDLSQDDRDADRPG